MRSSENTSRKIPYTEVNNNAYVRKQKMHVDPIVTCHWFLCLSFILFSILKWFELSVLLLQILVHKTKHWLFSFSSYNCILHPIVLYVTFINGRLLWYYYHIIGLYQKILLITSR